jgi:hypothetical protein
MLDVVGGVLVVAVERHRPLDLLRRRIDLRLPRQVPDSLEDLAGDEPDGHVGDERDVGGGAAAVLDHRAVAVQVERDPERARPVGRGQRGRLEPPRRQPQRRVLQLRLGRGERRRQLAQHLRVGVQRVAGVLPIGVGRKRGPGLRHAGNRSSVGLRPETR